MREISAREEIRVGLLLSHLKEQRPETSITTRPSNPSGPNRPSLKNNRLRL